MKISYNWLKEFVDIKVTPAKLAEDLSLFGHEVESIKSVGDDFILDFEITPNRGDCLSILGMAREVSALYGLKIKHNMGALPEEIDLDENIKVDIKDKKICPRYSYVIIDEVEIKESPKWLRDKLEIMGFRSINNIVDVTNYVMLELGQPMHAYDYNKIADVIYNIRVSKKGESIITLDGKTRELDDAIVIADGKKIFDLAGIMGGANSEVDKNTKTIVLEAAVFDPVLVRKTSKNLKLQTDASYRYERSIDPNGTIFAIQRAMNIVLESCKLAKFGKINDIQSDIQDNEIRIDVNKINNLIGGKFNEKEMESLLAKLNFKLENSIVVVPSYRSHDVKIWQDTAEELARIYGYNKLGISEINKLSLKKNINYNIKESIKDEFVLHGFSEVYSYSFTDKKLLELCGFKLNNLRKVINGLTPETEYLRSNLLPSLLTAVAKNPWAPAIKIFEIGKVFDENIEKWQLGIAITSRKATEIENVLRDLGIKADIFSPDQKILDYLKIRKSVLVAVVDLNKIDIRKESYNSNLEEIHCRKVSEYSPTIRDLAFIVDKNIKALDIQKAISECDDHVLITELFDEFESDKFGVAKKNIAFHVWLQDLKGPMDDQLTNEIINKIVASVESNFSAKLRNS